jgi:hypothetical protein
MLGKRKLMLLVPLGALGVIATVASYFLPATHARAGGPLIYSVVPLQPGDQLVLVASAGKHVTCDEELTTPNWIVTRGPCEHCQEAGYADHTEMFEVAILGEELVPGSMIIVNDEDGQGGCTNQNREEVYGWYYSFP